MQRGDRVAAQRQAAADAHAGRQRVGDRLGARQVLLDELAQHARRERARGVVDGHHAARVQPLPRLRQHLVLAHGQLEAASGAHRRAQLQQLTGQERAREEALVEPDRASPRPSRPARTPPRCAGCAAASAARARRSARRAPWPRHRRPRRPATSRPRSSRARRAAASRAGRRRSWMPRLASAALTVWVRTSTSTARRSRSGALRGFGRSRAGTANVIPPQDTSAGGRGRDRRRRPGAAPRRS